MDWKYQHFHQEGVFQAQRDVVFEAFRAFAAESLAGWQITETTDGFEAKGQSASHAATANFRIEPASSGTKVAVTLSVTRAGSFGFMLFDIGGYYDRQLRKWLESIGWNVNQILTSAPGQRQAQPGQPANSDALARVESFFTGCVLILIFCPIPIFFVCALIGLLSGTLFLPGSRGHRSITLHGSSARSGAVLILALYLVGGCMIAKSTKKARPKILFPEDGK